MIFEESPGSSIRLSNGKALDPFVVKLLKKRGVVGQKAISTFLEPKLADLPSPFLMKGMRAAVEIIEKAIQQKQTILIWGDYDVDGTTATALLLKFFEYIGCNAAYYIPNRLIEGYGLQENGLNELSQKRDPGNTVLITVDNGIAATEAVERAKYLGYKVIITDHHTPPPEEVPADAILNPKQSDCQFPAKNLAGVGVAFYLAMGIRSHLANKHFFDKTTNKPNLKLLLDLVAIGTVADMVPLHGINRILVRAGMETVANKSNVGLAALCRANNLDPGFIRSEDISFQLAPKINAAGRLGDADNAIRLFMAKGEKESQGVARALVENNELRKNINISDYDKAIRYIKESDTANTFSVFVSGDYHIGVAGIVASNLVEKYKKPSIVLCKMQDGVYRGSARSVPGIDLYSALEKCSELLLGFGGHKMAGGMTVAEGHMADFKALFDKVVWEQGVDITEDADKRIDSDIEITKLFKASILRQLHLFEPFGQGNPELIFRDTTASLHDIRPIGRDKKHLRLSFGANDKGKNIRVKGIAFGFGAYAGDCRSGKEKEILYTPSMNFYRGKRNWQVRVTSITFSGSQHTDITI